MSGKTFSEVALAGGLGSGSNSPLMQILMAEDIQPGDEPSYQLCKTILVAHPLGAKMTEGPITLAQSQEREITIQDAPDEVKQAFIAEREALQADTHIKNVHTLARAYGISTLVMGVRGVPSNQPVDMEKIWNQEIFFNVLDPLNTAGSLVLSQNPSDPNFQRPVTVRTSGDTYHHSRFRVVMNERPIFIEYTQSAFGFVGRSVYQRALFPLKSFIRSMISDDMIQTKLMLIIAKQKSPGSVVNQQMQKMSAWKRVLLKFAQSGQVLSMDIEEDASTFNMMNVDGAGTYSRNNIIRNIETAADMPAKMLDQETMVSGFGEGTEDAKRNALYVGRIRVAMGPEYRWFDNITQYRAWNPEWYKRVIQSKYEQYKGVDFQTAFMEWRQNFHAEWPSLLIEPESEAVKREQVKLEAVIAILNALAPLLDPANKARLIQFVTECFSEDKRLFPRELELDWDALADFQQETQDKQDESHEAETEGKKGFPSFGDSAVPKQLEKLRAAMDAYVAEVSRSKPKPKLELAK
jgi:Protein of unknown function (DUF1073)